MMFSLSISIFLFILFRLCSCEPLSGSLDQCTYNKVSGWCVESVPPRGILDVKVKFNGEVLLHEQTGVGRPDVAAALGIKFEKSGFSFSIASVLDGLPYLVGGYQVEVVCVNPNGALFIFPPFCFFQK